MHNVHMGTKERIAPQALGMEVAALLRESVARRELTQAQVAEKSGISTSQVSKYLRGVRPITVDELDRVCSAIGVSFERLIVEAAYRTRGRKSAGPSGHEIDDRPADDVRRILEAPPRGEEGWWEPAAATGE